MLQGLDDVLHGMGSGIIARPTERNNCMVYGAVARHGFKIECVKFSYELGHSFGIDFGVEDFDCLFHVYINCWFRQRCILMWRQSCDIVNLAMV